MHRTNVYLDDEQRDALRCMAQARDVTVSDLVRRAVDRLLREEFSETDYVAQMQAVTERMRARYGACAPSEDDIDAAIARRRNTNVPS